MIGKLNNLTQRYVFALAVVAVLVTTSFVFSSVQFRSRENMTAVVKVSNQQQLLPQEISLLALNYASASNRSDREILRDELEQSVALYETSHQALLEGGTVPLTNGTSAVSISKITSPELELLFQDDPTNLNLQATQFIEAARNLLQVPVDELSTDNSHLIYLLQNSSSLVDAQREAFEIYQNRTRTLLDYLWTVERGRFVGALIILTLLGVLVFRPISRKIDQQTQILQDVNAALVEENKLATAKSQDLALATEISQRLATINDLGTLLRESVEIIRSRFQLYYVQIYLVNQADQLLVLKAGTGDVGQTLVNHGFTLPLGLNSINGIAAIEQREIIVNDTLQSLIFRPNKLLPDTRSEMVVPLFQNEDVIAVLDLQSRELNAFSIDSLSIFKSITGQLSAAILNAMLLEQVRHSKEKGLVGAQEKIAQDWDVFLDGINESRSITLTETGRLLQPDLNDDADQVTEILPIKVMGQQIGEMTLVVENGRFLTEQEKNLAAKVSTLVSGRLENLRLLSMNHRYREEAESATRRVTRDSWQEYLGGERVAGYEFDLNQVTSLSEETPQHPSAPAGVQKPIQIQGEAIGFMVLEGESDFTADKEAILTAVSEQFGNHIENLRLTEQTEKALQETELYSSRLAKLNELSTALNAVYTVDDAIDILIAKTPEIIDARRVSITLIDADDPEFLVVVGQTGVQTGDEVGTRLILAETPMGQAIQTGTIQKGSFMNKGERLETRFVPLKRGDTVIGTLNIGISNAHLFTMRNEQLLDQIALLVSTQFEKLQLFEQTQIRTTSLMQLTQIETELSKAKDENELVTAVLDACTQPNRITLSYFDEDIDGNIAYRTIISRWQNGKFLKKNTAKIKLQSSHPIFNEWQKEPGKIVWIEENPASSAGETEAKVSHHKTAVSYLQMPLHSLDRWQGVLEFEWFQKHTFTENEKLLMSQLVETLAAHVAIKRLIVETELLYKANTEFNKAESYQDILNVFKKRTYIGKNATIVNIAHFNTPWLKREQPEFIDIVGRISDVSSEQLVSSRYQLTDLPALDLMSPDHPTIIEDITNDPRLDDQSRQQLHQPIGIYTFMIFPLVTGNSWYGYLGFFSKTKLQVTGAEVRQLSAMVEQAAIAIQGIRLLKQAQTRAYREQQIREISAKLRNSTSVEAIMRNAVQEVGKAIGRHSVLYLEPAPEDTNSQD